MKNSYKYLIVGLLLLVTIATVVLLLSKDNKDVDIEDQITDQLSACEEVFPSYVGLSENDAVSRAERENRIARIVKRDDESFAVTMDYSPSRLNFEITSGSVSKASCG